MEPEFKTYRDYNQFRRELAKSGRLLKVVQSVYGQGGFSGKFDFNMHWPGEICSNVRYVMDSEPEAVFRDGTFVRINADTFTNFTMAHRSYNIEGLS